MENFNEKRFNGYVGMPRALKLNQFAAHVKQAFNAYNNVYLVGSALKTKEWHDLDIVVILSDEEWARHFVSPESRFLDPKWIALVLAFSALGKEMLECAVDFQIHPKSYSDINFPGERLLL